MRLQDLTGQCRLVISFPVKNKVKIMVLYSNDALTVISEIFSGRLCCPLGVIGIRIPPPPNMPPYFGLRPSNPGEVIPRGSLPSDRITLTENEKGDNSFRTVIVDC